MQTLNGENIGFLPDGSGIAMLICNHKWKNTSLGPINNWPHILKNIIGLVLNSTQPNCLFWGKELIFFCNDAYQATVGSGKLYNESSGFTIDMTNDRESEAMKAAVSEVMQTGSALLHASQAASVFLQTAITESFRTFSYNPIKNESGKTLGVMVAIDDTTEKIEAQRKAEGAEERARLAVEIAGIATWELNLQSHEMTHSQTLATIFGHPESFKLTYAMMLSQIDPADLLHVVEQAFESAMRTGKYKYEAKIIKKPGDMAWIRSHGKIFLDAHGEPLKMVGSMIDITLERNRREVLIASEQQFRLLADSLPQLIWTVDFLGNANYFNLSVYSYTGLTKQRLHAGGVLQLLHPEDRLQYTNSWAGAIEKGEGFMLEHRLQNEVGEFIWHLSSAIAQKDALDNVQMWVGTSTNIQNQKNFTNELEDQVQQRTAELVETNMALVDMNIELQSFAYVSSHDLQEPLRKIQMFLSQLSLNDASGFSENAKVYFNKINLATIKMRTLIQDLLTYSKASSSDKIFVSTHLEELAKEVLFDFKDVTDVTQAVIELHSLCETKVIPFQFRQLFNNLIGNAIKFAKPNTAPHIVISGERVNESQFRDGSTQPDKKYCHIRFADNGIGFEAQYEQRIFEVFKRLHGDNEYSGTGIGLAIVKKIVDNHGGFIAATGKKGVGAQFDIYIPEV